MPKSLLKSLLVTQPPPKEDIYYAGDTETLKKIANQFPQEKQFIEQVLKQRTEKNVR